MADLKICVKCVTVKPFSEFVSDKQRPDGKYLWCKDCQREPRAEWYEKNRDRQRALAKIWRTNNREKQRLATKQWKRKFKATYPDLAARRTRAHNLKHFYGITIEDFDSMFRAQNGRCAICGTKKQDAKGDRFHVDHNHDTKKVRGLLCSNCNTILGYAKENIETLKAAIDYLERHCGK